MSVLIKPTLSFKNPSGTKDMDPADMNKLQKDFEKAIDKSWCISSATFECEGLIEWNIERSTDNDVVKIKVKLDGEYGTVSVLLKGWKFNICGCIV